MTKLQLRIHELPSNGPQIVPALIIDDKRISTNSVEFNSGALWDVIHDGAPYTLEVWGADGTHMYFETNEAPARTIEDSGATVYTWNNAAVTMD